VNPAGHSPNKDIEHTIDSTVLRSSHSGRRTTHCVIWIIDCLGRYDNGDWGDLDPDDQASNDHKVRHRNGRVLSHYPLPVKLIVDTTDDDAMRSSPTTLTTPTPQPRCCGRAIAARVGRYPRAHD
jgi:hypothetical protein